jgi:hypothetical protein
MIKLMTLIGIAAFTVTPRLQSQIVYPVNFRFELQTAGGHRNASIDDIASGQLKTSIKGIEAYLSPRTSGVGIGGRWLSGDFGDDEFKIKEGRLLLGENWFRIEAGYGERSLIGTDSTARFTRVGIQSIVQIGGVGVSLKVSGSIYLRGDFSGSKPKPDDPSGWEGETGIYYNTPRVPLFAKLGYRTEYFERGPRAEHLSELVFGTGIWLGGRN